MRLLHNILPLAPCGKPQAAHFAHLVELLALDASFVPKSGDQTWDLGWFGSGMARAARRGLEVSLLTAVDAEEAAPIPSAPGSLRVPPCRVARPAGRPPAGR